MPTIREAHPVAHAAAVRAASKMAAVRNPEAHDIESPKEPTMPIVNIQTEEGEAVEGRDPANPEALREAAQSWAWNPTSEGADERLEAILLEQGVISPADTILSIVEVPTCLDGLIVEICLEDGTEIDILI